MPGSLSVRPGVLAFRVRKNLFGIAHWFRFVSHEALGPGLIYAKGLLIHEVASGGVGSCAAAHAYVAEFTTAALSFQLVRIAQLVEHSGVLPDIRERLFAQVSGYHGQITARVNLTLVRNETHPCSRKTPLGHRVEVRRM